MYAILQSVDRVAQDCYGGCLGKSWLWQSQRVPPGPTFRRHLSLKLCWAALRRIHDPSSCGDQLGCLLVKFIVVSNQSFPSGSFLRYSRRLKVSKHNQPEFSPSTEKLLKTHDPTTFPTCHVALTHLTLPINHNPHLHPNTPTPFPTPPRRALAPCGRVNPSCPCKIRIPNTVDRLQSQLTTSPSRLKSH